MADTYSPNDGMKSAARRALAWKKDGRRGGTIIGVTRAHQIVNGENLSASTVKRMYSFFSRHEVDKRATGFSSGEEGYPSPGRVAWDLWGGDAGFSWSRRLVAGMEKADELSIDPTKKNPQQGTYRPAPQMRLKDNGEQMDGEDVGESPDAWAGLNERQDDQAEAYCMIVEEYGQFDQSPGPDGAHYAPGDKNPFKSDGLVCENCIFFEGNACHLVSGEIDPEGICKLWIIAAEGGKQEMETENQDMEMSKRDYSPEERRRMAANGEAMQDGSYPIATVQDLRNAIQAFGRAKNPQATKRHIISRARALGRVDLLPEEWGVKKSEDSVWQGMFSPRVK